MRSILMLLALITITESFALESATQPDFSQVSTETAKQLNECIQEAMSDDSGYEVDDSEAEDYCEHILN